MNKAWLFLIWRNGFPYFTSLCEQTQIQEFNIFTLTWLGFLLLLFEVGVIALRWWVDQVGSSRILVALPLSFDGDASMNRRGIVYVYTETNVRKICNAISEDIETPLNESSVVKPIQKLTRITYLREIHNAEDEAKWISRMDHLISFVQHDRRTKSELSTSKGAEG